MEKSKVRLAIVVWLSVMLMFIMPLIGAFFAGNPPEEYLSFPPRTRQVEVPPFNSLTFLLLSCITAMLWGPLLFRWVSSRGACRAKGKTSGRMPWWGYAGFTLCFVSWVLAWTRFPWFQPFQRLTFLPLWLSYILIVNSLTFKRSGRCMMTGRPVYFLSLFIASALFWWFFEYLNRFVNNWYYEDMGRVSPAAYLLFSGFPFSTVLPAVCGTSELLETFSGSTSGMDRFLRLRFKAPVRGVLVVFVLSLFLLGGIGYRPDLFFPFLWIAPLMLLVALLYCFGEKTLFSGITQGDWSRVWLMSISALICGFFWEMWNFYSLARWEYAIPYVAGFYIFEMPVLGYAGYLPFGLECAVVADIARRLSS